jgi:uncharacterized protein
VSPALGVRVSVQVTARASTNSAEALDDGSVHVRVTAPPADGAANQSVVRVLADALGVAPSRLRIVSGATARRKVVEVSGMTQDQLAPRLREFRA